jgi:hypothetical protein
MSCHPGSFSIVALVLPLDARTLQPARIQEWVLYSLASVSKSLTATGRGPDSLPSFVSLRRVGLLSRRGAGSENGHHVETGPAPCRGDAVHPGYHLSGIVDVRQR